MLERLIAKYGILPLAGAGLVLLVLMFFGFSLGWAKVSAWYYQGKAERQEQRAERAEAETKVARKDEAQVTRAAEITAATTQAQDAGIASARTATNKTAEVIDERIHQNPAPAAVDPDPVVADRIVWNAAEAAAFRAQGAQNRLRRAKADGSAAEPAP